MTITPFDDYPIHQTALPVAHPGSGDRNHYDRYFFNGFDPGGEWFFAVAMGVYPNRRVADAAFSLVSGGVQRSAFASGRAPLDRAVTRVGPIAIEVVEPLRLLRVTVDTPDVRAELSWEARTAAVEEPRMTVADGPVVILDSTRMVQWGRWNGTVSGNGTEIGVRDAPGTRDRSWGVRPVGEFAGGAPSGIAGGGLFMLWAPVHFDRDCSHLALFETPEQGRTYTSAMRVPVLGAGGAVFGEDSGLRHADRVDYDVELEPGTRRWRRASLRYAYRGGGSDELQFEPLLRFHMKGIGYFHPEWGHGVWHGESAVHSETWKLDELNLTDPTNFHVETLARVRRGGETGTGVLEHLSLGPHAPTGLAGFADVAG